MPNLEVSEPTHFASAERALPSAVRAAHDMLVGLTHVVAVLDALPCLAGVLNRERQFVLANRALRTAIGDRSPEEALGLRPGEALSCVNAENRSGGCGTAAACRVCGAALAILESQRTGTKVTRECRITHADGTSAFDFRVTAAPLVADGTPYTVLSLEDVSDANRKRALERIFFHDIMNTAGSMRNLLELVPAEMPGGGDADLLDSVRRAADILVDEILGQKQLFAAETGDLQVVPKPVEVRSFLEQAVIRWSGLDVAKRRIIELRKGPDGTVSTDPALLHRCLTNMVKNAVESASRGDTVTVWWEWESRRLLLKVRNPGVMPPDVQLQVFQRSFSTKGVGRGIGTYSMKLLGEAYLGGTVSFTSTESDGTVFTLALPRGGTPAGEGSAR